MSANDIKLKHARDSLSTKEFPGDIVTFGKVSLELTKSSSGEKLILVGNSEPNRRGRRRFLSLSQTGFLPNTNNPEVLYYSTNNETNITKKSTAERRLNIFDNKIYRQERIDRLNLIHDYFQHYDPKMKQRRRVQSK